MAQYTAEQLADLEAIRDLARRYAHSVWQRDADAAIDLFAEDGEMDTGDRPPIKGREALLEAYQVFLGEDELLPLLSQHVVELDGDRATGTCYLDLRATMAGEPMIGAGFYEDRYKRVNGAWKFQSRKLTLKFFAPLKEGWS